MSPGLRATRQTPPMASSTIGGMRRGLLLAIWIPSVLVADAGLADEAGDNPATFPWPEFLERLAEIPEDDAPGLLDLGAWCAENENAPWARRCYLAAAGRDDSVPPTVNRARLRCEAVRRLAALDEAEGRKDLAYQRLRRAATQWGCDDAKTRDAIAALESAVTRQQRELIEEGERRLDAGKPEAAIRSLQTAYDLGERAEDGEARIAPREFILSMVRARQIIEDQRAAMDGRFLALRSRACDQCGRTGYFACPRCRRRRRIWQPVRHPVSGRLHYRKVMCPARCGTTGTINCDRCLETLPEHPTIGLMTRFFSAALKREWVNESGERAYALVRNGVLQASRDAPRSLWWWSQIDVRDVVARKLDWVDRRMMAVFPPPEQLESFSATWATLQSRPKAGIYVLAAYGMQYLSFLSEFRRLESTRPPQPSRLLREPTPATRVYTPAEACAFQNRLATSPAVTIRGEMPFTYGHTPIDWSATSDIELAADLPHDIRFFVWHPPARDMLRRLARGRLKRSLRRFGNTYPFTIGAQIPAQRLFQETTVTGRFLTGDDRNPQNWFEVWRVEFGEDPFVLEMRRALEPRIEDFEAENAELADVVRALSLGSALEFDTSLLPLPHPRVTARFQNCPLGLTVDAICRDALGVSWMLYDGVVRLGEEPEPFNADRVTRLLAALRSDASPDTTSVAQALSDERAATPLGRGSPTDSAASPAGRTLALLRRPPPRDELGARVFARLAARNHRFRRAATVLEDVGSGEGNESSNRLVDKYLLFDAMLDRVKRSGLTNAPDLSRIVYRVEDGPVHDTIVRVLSEDTAAIRILTSRGERFRIRRDSIIDRDPIAWSTWMSARRTEFEARRARIDAARDAPSEERVLRLFLLEAFAKSSGLESGGEALSLAIDDEAFPAFLEEVFPVRKRDLELLWRSATARDRIARSNERRGPSHERPGRSTEPISAPLVLRPPLSIDTIDSPDDAPEPILVDANLGRVEHEVTRYMERGRTVVYHAVRIGDAGTWRTLAAALFTESRRALDAWLALRPSDARAKSLRSDASRWLDIVERDLDALDG